MRNFKLTTKTAIAAMCLLPAVFCGCGGAKLEQRVYDASCIQGTKYINTEVWVYSWTGMPKTLEYSELKCVTYSKVDSTKQSEYIKAIPVLEAAKNCR